MGVLFCLVSLSPSPFSWRREKRAHRPKARGPCRKTKRKFMKQYEEAMMKDGNAQLPISKLNSQTKMTMNIFDSPGNSTRASAADASAELLLPMSSKPLQQLRQLRLEVATLTL